MKMRQAYNELMKRTNRNSQNKDFWMPIFKTANQIDDKSENSTIHIDEIQKNQEINYNIEKVFVFSLEIRAIFIGE